MIDAALYLDLSNHVESIRDHMQKGMNHVNNYQKCEEEKKCVKHNIWNESCDYFRCEMCVTFLSGGIKYTVVNVNGPVCM